MIFGLTPLSEAVGAILAHAARHKSGLFKKGRVLSREDVIALKEAGHASVIAARLGSDDVPENEAARRVAIAVCGGGARPQEPFTGRANLYATAKGIFVVDEERLHAINHLHESLTIATLPNYSRVEPRQMVATVKVIPFAVPRPVLEQALAIIGAEPLLRVSAFKPHSAALILTRLPQSKETLLAKSEVAIRARLVAAGATLSSVTACAHEPAALRQAILSAREKELSPILVLGASAIVDRADVIPEALVDAGGAIVHLGMPVDPGNLLMLGDLEGTPVVGVPSCARSPKINGFDWVLERLLAGLPVTQSDIMDMGVGGLLAEIPSRPSPREGTGPIPKAPRIAAVILAAGTSARMGSNKLLAALHGQPLIAQTVARVSQSSVDRIILVTGRDAGKVTAVVGAQSKLATVYNPDFASGMASSIRAGVLTAKGMDAVLVCLGDMPLVRPGTIDRMIAAFNPAEQRTIIVPAIGGKAGNPVLWGAEHFPRLLALSGDAGARKLLTGLQSETVEIDVDDSGILADADTPEDLERLRALPE